MTDPTRRVLRLLSLLQSRPAWSGPEPAEELGVTVRTGFELEVLDPPEPAGVLRELGGRMLRAGSGTG